MKKIINGIGYLLLFFRLANIYYMAYLSGGIIKMFLAIIIPPVAMYYEGQILFDNPVAVIGTWILIYFFLTYKTKDNSKKK